MFLFKLKTTYSSRGSILEHWLRKYFLTAVFVNTSVPSERIPICKPVEEIAGLDQDSTDIFK